MFKATKPKLDDSGNLIIKKKKNPYSLLIGICVVILLIIGYLNMNYLYAAYYYTFKFKHFGKGDNVYASQAYTNEKKYGALAAMQIIKPLTQVELETMHINEVEKSFYKINSNPNSKTYAAITGTFFKMDSLRKYGVRRIGTFLKYDWVSVKDVTGKGLVTVLLCAVKPDPKFVSLQQQPFQTVIPSGYILADSTIYIDPFQLSEK